MNYKDSGVDIDKAEVFKKQVKRLVRGTFTKAVLTDIGMFGGVYSFGKGMAVVATIDGVGTKTIIASLMNRHDVIGYDVVAHCANDLAVQGARPMFTLDYIGAGKLDNNTALQLVKGMVKACRETGCALIGGETAQMPGIYKEGEYDLVGCMIGAADKKKLIDGSRIRPGDVIVGLASSGLHTNGYSLARKVLFEKYDVSCFVPELKTTLGKALLKPHKNYSGYVLGLMRRVKIKGMAHITGGGLPGNIPRILPPGTDFIIDRHSWTPPRIFRLIQEEGNIPEEEMYRTFNMGIGMVIIADRKAADKIREGVKIGIIVKG